MPMKGVKLYIPPNIDLYKTQKNMLLKLLGAVQEKTNALIESPTGSGKTLALLSGACSWFLKYEEERWDKMSMCPKHSGDEATKSPSAPFDGNTFGDHNSSNPTDNVEEMPNESNMSGRVSDVQNESNMSGTNECNCPPKTKIYYCTRTHKQISQVVDEFKRLPFYKIEDTQVVDKLKRPAICKSEDTQDVDELKRPATCKIRNIYHTILASREQSCVNKAVREATGDGNLNSRCRKALEPKGSRCVYKETLQSLPGVNWIRKRMKDGNTEVKGLDVWNIEDLISNLPALKLDVCPYFLTNREFTKDASIIFCPFNYLIDPAVRSSSDVHLKNSIIIVDEAHNIEDVCRNAASFEFSDMELEMSLHNIKANMDGRHQQKSQLKKSAVSDKEKDPHNDSVQELEAYLGRSLSALNLWHRYLTKFYGIFSNLIEDVENMKPEDGIRFKNMNAGLVKQVLSGIYLNFDENNYNNYREASSLLFSKDQFEQENGAATHDLNLKLNQTAVACIQKILLFFKFHSKSDNWNHYRGNLEISPGSQQGFEYSQSPDADPPKELIPGHTVKLRFWCMSPSVAFNDAFNECRSVILASGTLCPLTTFCGELGVQFKHTMEGEQVISKDRIFAAPLAVGPSNKALRLTYANMQDGMLIREIAKIIYDVCEIVPGGVLIFVSSYRVLEQLRAVFCQVGLMKKLHSLKEVFYEPRQSNEMTKFMARYNEAIEIPRGTRNGAAMFAVFRGKISEGLDFADDKARAVITVGIPFPSIKDQQVQLKRSFNDLNEKAYGILKGGEWYEIQAYRAVNQALGRCLRHKNDWGALIMIDERYNPAQKKISKWVRDNMRNNFKHTVLLQQLREFVNRHTLNSTTSAGS